MRRVGAGRDARIGPGLGEAILRMIEGEEEGAEEAGAEVFRDEARQRRFKVPSSFDDFDDFAGPVLQPEGESAIQGW